MKIIIFVKDHVVKVVEGSFALQRELMKRVETVECKSSLRPREGSREPASTHELSATVNDAIRLAITEIDRNIMNSCCIEKAEVGRPRRWARAWGTAVAKLNTKAKALKTNGVEKQGVPILQYILTIVAH